jgi:hypothetical protein
MRVSHVARAWRAGVVRGRGARAWCAGVVRGRGARAWCAVRGAVAWGACAVHLLRHQRGAPLLLLLLVGLLVKEALREPKGVGGCE